MMQVNLHSIAFPALGMQTLDRARKTRRLHQQINPTIASLGQFAFCLVLRVQYAAPGTT
jgi:hypothetical protein